MVDAHTPEDVFAEDLAERATRLKAYADASTNPTVARMEALLAAQAGDVDPTGMTDEELTDALYERLVARVAAEDRACRTCGASTRDDMPALQARARELRAAREVGQ